MSDAEISHFCSQADFDVSAIFGDADNQNVRKFALDPKVFLEGGKVAALQKHIERCKAEGKRMLLFSQVSRRCCFY
jgi:SWI/SNF-related matrix-associated actin-dependent regulator 1 of chromatin subfamily A